MVRQLPLPVTLRDEASFANFYTRETPEASSRAEATQLLRVLNDTIASAGNETSAFAAEFAVYLWGPLGSGKTHLAQACCRQFVDAGHRAMYLPLAELIDYPAQQVLADLEHNELVCVDDIHLVAQQDAWQQGLFDLYNRLRDKGRRLVLTGVDSPGNSDIALADLRSRLAAATGFGLAAYTDEERVEILCFRARGLGLSLPHEVARYLLSRAPRDINTLIECLHRLDREALAGQRRLTVPFVKLVFDY